MNRLDVIRGHFVFYSHQHRGQGCRLYARLSRMSRYYTPAPSDFDLAQSGAEDAREIYDALAWRFGVSPFGKILTGHAAIDYAARIGARLNKYEDPTEDARTGLTVEEARDVASEDPSLIWVSPFSAGGQ